MEPALTHVSRKSLLLVTRDALPRLAEAGQLFYVNMDQLACHLAFKFVLQVASATQTQAVHSSGNIGERCGKQPGDVAQVKLTLVCVCMRCEVSVGR